MSPPEPSAHSDAGQHGGIDVGALAPHDGRVPRLSGRTYLSLPHDILEELEPTPMSRAQPLSDTESPFVETPREVRARLDRVATQPPFAVILQQQPRMVSLDEDDKVLLDSESSAELSRQDQLANRIGKAFAVLATLACIVGAIAFWMHDSKARPGSRFSTTP